MCCVLEQDALKYPLLSTGSTQKDPSGHDLKIADWDVNDQTTNKLNCLKSISADEKS